MKDSTGYIRVFALASAAAAVAACVEGMTAERPKAAASVSVYKERLSDTPPTPGEWRYKESGEHPWAGFGPPRQDPILAITCQSGEIVFQRRGGSAVGVMTIMTDAGKAVAPLTDPVGEFAEGRLPANSPLIGSLLKTESRFAVSAGAQTIILPPDSAYRRVIRACLYT